MPSGVAPISLTSNDRVIFSMSSNGGSVPMNDSPIPCQLLNHPLVSAMILQQARAARHKGRWWNSDSAETNRGWDVGSRDFRVNGFTTSPCAMTVRVMRVKKVRRCPAKAKIMLMQWLWAWVPIPSCYSGRQVPRCCYNWPPMTTERPFGGDSGEREFMPNRARVI